MVFRGKIRCEATPFTLRRVAVFAPMLAVACLCLGAGFRDSDWKTIVSRDGAFRIEFPSDPKEGKKEIETAAGKLASHSYILEEGPISFFVSWLEFPANYVRRVGSVDILNGAKEAFFKRFKGKFDRERIIQLGAAPGRDVAFTTEDDVKFRLRIFLRGNRLVQTMVMSEPEYIDSSDANRFLDSLKWD